MAGLSLDPAFLAIWASATGEFVAGAVRSTTPVRTGTLRRSTSWRIGGPGLIEVTAQDGLIPRYVIRGTRPHVIEPRNASALHFTASDGTEVFTRRVQHPGTQPNRYPERAWGIVAPLVLSELARIGGHSVHVRTKV